VGEGLLAGVVELDLEFGDLASFLFLLQLGGGVKQVQLPGLLALVEEIFLDLDQKTLTR
jgi:hypothetical protein